MTTSDPQSTPAPTQPPDSKITFVPSPNSLTFIIPHTGFRGAAAVLLLFSLIWSAIAGAIFTTFLLVFLRELSFVNILPLLFISLFLLIGFFTFLASLQFAFRKAVILATPDTLIYTQTGPIKKAEFQWIPKDIAAIRTDFSGTTVNNRRLRELQIHSIDTTKHRFFDGRPDPELEWLAYTLQNFYNLPNAAPSAS